MAEPAYAYLDPPVAATWPEQGSWSWDDYLRLPDDGHRYEIIQGVLYVAPAPIYVHQYVVSRLLHRLESFVLDRQLGVVLTAPFDVILPGIATPVQPDLLYLAPENLPDPAAKNFEGVPDLVVEVLSAGTSRVDRHVKFAAYEKAGVREYWMVDPRLRNVVVFGLDVGSREYRELGRFGIGEKAHSEILAGFEVAVGELFP